MGTTSSTRAPFVLRLTAHKFTRSPDGALGVNMTHQGGGKALTPCATLEQAHQMATTFGEQNAPCVVWAGIANGRSPRGFNAWAEALAQQTFGEGDA